MLHNSGALWQPAKASFKAKKSKLMTRIRDGLFLSQAQYRQHFLKGGMCSFHQIVIKDKQQECPDIWTGFFYKVSQGVEFCSFCCRSVAKSCPTLCEPMNCSNSRLPCPSLSPEVCSNSCPLSWWCHSTISSSVAFFSSCPQSFPATGSFPMSWLFASGVWRIGASASQSVPPMNIQGWFPLGLTGFISLLLKGLLRVFSSTTVPKHQFFGAQSSSQSNSHIHTWPMEKP